MNIIIPWFLFFIVLLLGTVFVSWRLPDFTTIREAMLVAGGMEVIYYVSSGGV